MKKAIIIAASCLLASANFGPTAWATEFELDPFLKSYVVQSYRSAQAFVRRIDRTRRTEETIALYRRCRKGGKIEFDGSSTWSREEISLDGSFSFEDCVGMTTGDGSFSADADRKTREFDLAVDFSGEFKSATCPDGELSTDLEISDGHYRRRRITGVLSGSLDVSCGDFSSSCSFADVKLPDKLSTLSDYCAWKVQ